MDTNRLETNNDQFEINVDPKNLAIVKRYFNGITERDKEIRSLPVPQKPWWLRIMVLYIRFYQNHISEKLGNRCVFEPSCSHYSELAFRKYGFFKGLKLTINRLKRCKPDSGGIDELI